MVVASSRGGAQAGSYWTAVSLRVVVSWNEGALAVDQVNDLQDHLRPHAHWLGNGGTTKLDHESWTPSPPPDWRISSPLRRSRLL